MKVLSQRLYYFLGIGGIGMSALARFFHHYGKRVHGYDKTSGDITMRMEAEGIRCYYDENLARLKEILQHYSKSEVLVIYTPAVPSDHKEFVFLKNGGYSMKKRAEVLGDISAEFRTIAIAGTHGKTTTTTMVTHLLKSSGLNCFSFMGGISKNYDTNLVLGDLQDKNSWLVVEADEYDRSFLHLSPTIAIITSTDADHLDIYGDASSVKEGYALFAGKLKTGGTLIVKKTVDNDLSLKINRQVYSLNLDTEYCARGITVSGPEFRYDIVSPSGDIKDVILGLPGMHNVENSIAAVAAAQAAGIGAEQIREALRSFKGVKRRFDYRVNNQRVVYIDDYAHHPEELKATISSARTIYPGKKITGVFQPHLFTRTRDFADGFAKSLDLLDECLLLDIYPAREKPIPGVSSGWLLSKMTITAKRLVTKEELPRLLKEHPPEVLLTMGAGDIDRLVEPIEKVLNEI
jgi:UDP-N-acetylmuramate--alanine ligase